MKLLVEAFPAQPYVFKLIIADDDVRRLGTSWAADFEQKLEEYASSYCIQEVIFYGPGSFAAPIAEAVKQGNITNYVKANKIRFVEAGM